MKAAAGDSRDAAGQGSRTAVLRLRPIPESAASARDFTASMLSSWLVSDNTAQDVLLAVSELVTNAVEHGSGEVFVELINQGTCLRVQISDEGLGADPALIPLSPESPRSRGLAIVAAVSDSWGHRGGDDGLCVWAEFPLVRLDPI